MFNAYIQIKTLYKCICQSFFEKFLEPKRMQIFPLKLQFQKPLSDFFKNRSEIVYEFHMMLDTTVRSNLLA